MRYMPKIMADWEKYIHTLREKEIDKVVSFLNGKHYDTVLEIGAGDGFQSEMLRKYADKLYCTDLDDKRLTRADKEINYAICDAEIIDEYFPKAHFDLIFSSNLFEHLPNPGNALNAIYNILKADGISIHVIPSPFSAIIRIVLWYPAILLRVLNKMREGQKLHMVSERSANNKNIDHRSNNLKMQRSYKSNWRRLLFPRPHGVSENVFKEICAWKRGKWCKEIESSGFRIIDILKGPVSSGYGFGLDILRGILEGMGFTSEHIYILNKIAAKHTPIIYDGPDAEDRPGIN